MKKDALKVFKEDAIFESDFADSLHRGENMKIRVKLTCNSWNDPFSMLGKHPC